MNINFKFRKFYLLFISSLLFSSCLTNVEEEPIIDDGGLDPCKDVTFSINVKPIIDNNCIQCHGNGGNSPNLTTYNGVSANASKVNSEVVNRRMPLGGSLTTEEIEAISCWVSAGALNN